MYQPNKRKYKKEFRGKMRGLAIRGSKLAYGDFGLQSLECGWITGNQIEAARQAITRYTKRKGKLWIGVFPHKPVTAKSSEVTRGGGKGDVDHYVAVIKPGRVLLEIGGLPEDISKKALELGTQKLSVKTRVIKR
jgi:large subunit ribosomal protein L16